jgi:hypothetical protein
MTMDSTRTTVAAAGRCHRHTVSACKGIAWTVASQPPRYRVIFAVDVERSTTRTNPMKAQLRHTMYELIEDALRESGVLGQHHD